VRRVDPLPLGIVKVMVALAVSSFALGIGIPFDSPDADLMYSIAQVGIAIVFAYVVEAVWMVERVNRDDHDHRDWLGTTCGFGVAGLSGVGAALFVGGHRAAGHANFLDAVGLWWSVAALVLLGAIVIVQPLLADIDRARRERGPGEGAGDAVGRRSTERLQKPDPRPGAS